MIDSAKKALAVAFLSLWTGCVARFDVDPYGGCTRYDARHIVCSDGYYVWRDGYWNQHGVWVDGRYTWRPRHVHRR